MQIYVPCSCFFFLLTNSAAMSILVTQFHAPLHGLYFFSFPSDSVSQDGAVLRAGSSLVSVFHQWLPAVEHWPVGLGTVVTLFPAVEHCWLSGGCDCCHHPCGGMLLAGWAPVTVVTLFPAVKLWLGGIPYCHVGHASFAVELWHGHGRCHTEQEMHRGCSISEHGSVGRRYVDASCEHITSFVHTQCLLHSAWEIDTGLFPSLFA